MSIDVLLAQLERVKKTGAGRWKARCPGHDSASGASLHIRELDDGRVLMHDFGGCSVADVLAAVGLEMHALYPERPGAGLFNSLGRPERRPFSAHDVLACIAFETAIALDCANQLRAGKVLPPVDHARLVTACGRLVGALDVATGN